MKFMKRNLFSATMLVATIALVFGLQSCNSKKPITESELTGYWTLKTLNGEDSKAAFAGNTPSIQFNFDDNTLSGNGGCNTYAGGFTLTEQNSFSAPNLITTTMACMEPNKESDFFAALSTPELSISMSKDSVLTFTSGKDVVLEFVKGEAPQQTMDESIVTAETLAGNWELVAIDGGDVAALFADGVPTIVFSEDSKVSGNAGCNTYRASYNLEKNTITFGPLMSTKMACPSLKGEDLFTSLLANPVQVVVDGEKLTFFNDGNVILEFSKGAQK